MDPLTTLAMAFTEGFTLVGGKLRDYGFTLATDQLLAPLKERDRQRAVANTIVKAIEDATESDELRPLLFARLSEIVKRADLRHEVVRLVWLATTENPQLIPDGLLTALHLSETHRVTLARLVFWLHRRLNALPEFQPLLEATRDQAVITALTAMQADMSALASTVTDTAKGKAVRVEVVNPPAAPQPTQTTNIKAKDGGVAVARDNIGTIVTGARDVYIGAGKKKWNAEPYLRYLANECNRLRLSAIDPQYVKTTGEARFALLEVYTELEVESVVPIKGEGERLRPGRDVSMTGEQRTHRLTVLEAVSDAQHTRVVLLGAPGAGKSSCVNYLALCLAMALLEPDNDWLQRLPSWTQDALLPVRVVLREWVAWLNAQPQPHAPTAQALWDFVQHDLQLRGLDESFAPLKRQLLEQGGLVLLDGLDEVPDAGARREFVKSAVEDFARACSRSRLLVTCRPYAYREQRWKLTGFHEETLAPFSEDQMQTFVRRWYETIGPLERWSEPLIETKATELIGATTQPHLRTLAERPLLLTLMATLHSSRGKLPDDRATLYQDCVALMLDYWQRAKITSERGQEQVEDGVLHVLGVPRDTLQQALSRVAFEAHQRQGALSARNTETANLSGEQLRKALAPQLGGSYDKANVVIHYIQTRAGLLAEHGEDTYTFPHRTFQEFLTACYLLNSEHVPYDLAEWVRTDRDWWREVYLLAVGRIHGTMLGQAVALLNALCPSEYQAGQPIADEEAYAALLAAQAACEIQRSMQIAHSPATERAQRKLQNWLIGIITQSALPPIERAEAGRWLSLLGDPRADVSCDVPALVDVPAGEFIMGEGKERHRVTLPAYRIGKYPVTNAQYRRFVEDGGYTDKHRKCWTNAGWQWCEENQIVQPDDWNDPQWNLDNHPVVGVSWYEAAAYCNWLTKTTGQNFRLPTEAEWEKAARGGIPDLTGFGNLSGLQAREYPWGNEFEATKANTSESNINRTSAVGLFPTGKSVYDAYDMAGNVWEWCNSKNESYPYKNDARENLEGDDIRIQRGGSWINDAVNARCADRDWNSPLIRYVNVGFRVAESSPK